MYVLSVLPCSNAKMNQKSVQHPHEMGRLSLRPEPNTNTRMDVSFVPFS